LTNDTFLDKQVTSNDSPGKPTLDKFGFLIGTTKNTVNKSIGIILPMVFFFLFSYASAQQEQGEPKDAKFYIDRGNAHREKGQFDQAVDDFTKALKIDPKEANAYFYRGIAYGEKRQFDQAIDDFTEALKIAPKGVGAYYYRGIAYTKKGQFDWAIDDFTKALEIDPRGADAYFNRGVAYYFKGEYDKSREDIKKAQDLGYKVSPNFLDDPRKASGRHN
jgi:tetratricopeptide (TPR) repeat protein